MRAWISESRDFGRTYELRFVDETFGAAYVSIGVDEHGNIIMQKLDEGTMPNGVGILLPRAALDALTVAVRERDHDEWKVRYELTVERAERAEAEVERMRTRSEQSHSTVLHALIDPAVAASNMHHELAQRMLFETRVDTVFPPPMAAPPPPPKRHRD